jgi:hypothetical protein
LGTFEVEVIITPVSPSSGGGWAPTPIGQKPDRYRVTVRVKHNGKLYVDSVIVDDTEARVYAKLNGIETFTENEVMISVNGVQVVDTTVELKV